MFNCLKTVNYNTDTKTYRDTPISYHPGVFSQVGAGCSVGAAVLGITAVVLAVLSQMNIIQLPQVGIISPHALQLFLYSIGSLLVIIPSIFTLIHFDKIIKMGDLFHETDRASLDDYVVKNNNKPVVHVYFKESQNPKGCNLAVQC